MWPLALANVVREDERTALWTRIHSRQALVLGILVWPVFAIVLALPLVAVLVLPELSASATIAVYGAGFVLDLCVGIAMIVAGVRYAARAARGELFTIPIVTPVVERFFPYARR